MHANSPAHVVKPADFCFRSLNWFLALYRPVVQPFYGLTASLVLTFVAFAFGEMQGWAQRTTLIPLPHVWRYNTVCQDGTGWEQSGYADSAWPSGPGGFTGGETAGALLSVLNTQTLPAPNAAGRNGAASVAVIDFFPREGGEGTILTINGNGFHGGSPDDHCAILMKNNRFIDIEVLTATPTQLIARVGVIPPDCFGPLRLGVGVGDGGRVPLCPQERDVDVAPDNWVWRGIAPDMAVAPQPFFAVQATQPAGVPPTNPNANFHSGGPVNGMLMLVLDKDWGFGSRYCFSARIHAAGTGADTRIPSVAFTGVGNRFACAARICDLLIKAFAAPPPGSTPLNITCQVTTNAAGHPVLTVKLANGTGIDGGNIDIIQKAPPPIVSGLWDIQNAGLWRKEYRAHELARWYRHYNWTSIDRIWFEKRAEGIWINKQALETFTSRSHCIYRFANGRVWVIWRTFTRTDIVRFWAHYRFWWPGRLNPNLPANDPVANRTMMSMDDVQIVLPMTPQDPNPATPFNEGVQIIDENGQMHFQGQPGFEQMPDIAGNPNGFQLATTAHSTDLLPPAVDRIRDLPMQPMPGMAQLQPGVIIQWLVDKNGNVLVDHNQDGWPDPITSLHVLGNQKHPGLIAPPTGVAGTDLKVNFGNTPPQLYCWELDQNGEVRGAAPGQLVIGPAVDIDLDGQPDSPIGGPAAMNPTVRMPQIQGGQITEVRNNVEPVDIAVEEEAPPTDSQLAAMNAQLAAQLPGFVPLQRPFTLCISRIKVRQWWGIDTRVVFDAWHHHWTWHHRNHIILRHKACRVWLTKVSLSHFHSSHHHYVTWPFPNVSWSHYDLTQVRFLRICYRVLALPPNQVVLKVDQMHVVLPVDPSDPNSRLMLLSTQSDENKLFVEVPPPVLAGLQPDPLPVGPDGVFVEPIDPVAGTLDIGPGGAGVFGNLPLAAPGMAPATLTGNNSAANLVNNDQLQLFCWALNPNGTIAQETYSLGGPGVVAAPQAIILAVPPTPAIPAFEDELGNQMDNPTVFVVTVASDDNEVRITPISRTQARVEWEGPGQLEGAPTVTGIWSNVPGGTLSPVIVSLSTPSMRYFRVRR